MSTHEGVKKINESVIADGRSIIVNNEDSIDKFDNGTLKITPNGEVFIKKTGSSIWGKIIPYDMFAPKSLTNDVIADNNINAIKIQDGTITSNKLMNNSISGEKMLDYSVASQKLKDNSVIERTIANNVISSSKLKDNSVVESKISSGAVTNKKIADGAITSSKLEDGAVSTEKIADASITDDKIIEDGISKIKEGSINSIHIADNSINSDKISSLSGLKITDNTIDSSKLQNLSVTSGKLSNYCITTDKMLDGAVKTNKLAYEAVTSDKIASGSVNYIKLDANLKNSIDSSIKLSNDVAQVGGNLTVTGNINCNGTIRGSKVYNAVWNDIAEGYNGGEAIEPGYIVEIREDGKIYKANKNSTNTVGVVSDEYAILLGADEDSKKIAVGLIGKIHVYVKGKTKIGDKILIGNNGIGLPKRYSFGRNYIGKALETTNNKGVHKVLCQVYPH